MKSNSNVIELKKAIQTLTEEQSLKEELLIEQYNLTYESLKPVNILKNTVKEIISSPSLIEKTIAATAGLITGYVSKELIIGSKANLFRKILAPIIQLGITNLVAKNPDVLKFIGRLINPKEDNKKK